LRLIYYSPFSVQLLAGPSGGARAVEVDILSGGGDSVRARYRAFRRNWGRSKAFFYLGVTTLLMQFAAFDDAEAARSQQREDVALSLAVVPLSFAISANVTSRSARHHLVRAIEFYNASLSRAR